MPPSRAHWRFAFLFAFLFAEIARAQDAPIARAQEPDETIEVVGEKPTGSPRAPAAQSTVIEASRFGGEVRSVSEMLLTAPGVSVHALGGPGQAATLSLRGASADESLVLLDGIPLQGPGGGAVDLGTLPATLLERLVVSRGVLGAQFGAGALGGVVELLPRTAGQGAAGGVQLAAGSFGTAQAAVDLATPLGEGGSVLVAVQADRTAGDFEYARQRTPNVPDAPWYGFTRQDADAKGISGLARFARSVASQAEVDLLLQGSAGERGLPGPAGAYPPDRPSRSRELDESGLGGVRLRGAAGDASWNARIYGRLDRVELRGVSAFGGDCQDGAADCPRVDQRSSTARAEGEAEAPLAGTRFKTSLSAGEEWMHVNGADPHRRTLLSLALSDDLSLPHGFSLHPALRIERVGKDAGASPALTAAWKPSESGPLELRAGWGLSFRPATFSELYLERGGIAPDPTLHPERAWSADAGAAWRTDALTLSAGLFWSSYRDLIVYELYPPARAKPFNVGSARIAGLELQVIVKLPAGFLGEASYSFLDAVNQRPGAQQGNQLPYRPPHRLFARLARRGDRLEGYGEASFTSSMPRDLYGSAHLPNQLLLNAGLGLRAAGPLWIDVEAKNLLDDRTLEDLFQYPLPGLSIAVIARARL